MLSKALTKNVIVVEPFDPESIVFFFLPMCRLIWLLCFEILCKVKYYTMALII